MLTDLLLYILGFVGGLVVSTWNLLTSWISIPSAATSAISAFGYYIALASNILPDGMLGHLVTALTLVLTVNVFLIPWLVAQNLKIPFASIFGRK